MKPTGFRTLLLLLLGAALPVAGLAQAKAERLFKGVALDSLDRLPLEKGTLLFSGDSTTKARKMLTADDGSFSFKLAADTAFVTLQHVGYAQKRFAILPHNGKRVDTLFLPSSSSLMETVTVKAKPPPVVVRGDTTEFNIDSAMFEPFDVVQDLLRRLLGLEIDRDGRMTFGGKPITRILVDGEDLFGGDPDFSLRKLPAGLVAKIQVMDTKTLEQIFWRRAGGRQRQNPEHKTKGGQQNLWQCRRGGRHKKQPGR